MKSKGRSVSLVERRRSLLELGLKIQKDSGETEMVKQKEVPSLVEQKEVPFFG